MNEATQSPEPTSYTVEGDTYRELISERDLLRTENARLQSHLRQKSEQIARLQDGIERMQQDSSERAATEKSACCRQSPCLHPGVGPCDMPAVEKVDVLENVAGKPACPSCGWVAGHADYCGRSTVETSGAKERGIAHYRLHGHGHVVPRDDGSKARCGGPALCKHCQIEQTAIGEA